MRRPPSGRTPLPPGPTQQRRSGIFPLSALWFALSLLTAGIACAQRLELAWPTPNTAWSEGQPLSSFVQPTVSGETTSGLFGCVRSSGAQFHEGVDLKPVTRDRAGEPADPVYAALAGIVRHINTRAGESGYGRYIVLEHPDVSPAVYSLYAHLASVQPGLKRGDRVERGQTLAIMGRSAGGYTIPKDRAHLHFEFGVVVTHSFETWYKTQKFGSSNDHGVFNGMNLMGFDALDFFEALRTKKVDTFDNYFARMEPAVVLRIATRKVPDFTKRYPSLLTREPPMLPAGWEISVNATGLPFRWTPLSAADLMGYRTDEVRIVEVFGAVTKATPCKSLVVTKRGKSQPGKDLQTVLGQLFGLRM